MAAAPQVARSARQAARVALHKVRPSPTAALAKPVKKHEKLAKTLEWLNKEPKPILERINKLELTYAYRNNHFGARYVHTKRVLVLLVAPPPPTVLQTRHVSPNGLPFFVCGCLSYRATPRHFAKEELPRIAWNNPSLHIHVNRVLKKPEEDWKPIIKVSLSMSYVLGPDLIHTKTKLD